VQWTLREAEWLGITGQGVISKYGEGFLAGDDLEIIDADLPQPVDHILIQSDNTAIAPGPLVHDVAAVLAIIGDIEKIITKNTDILLVSETIVERMISSGVVLVSAAVLVEVIEKIMRRLS
jgi:hypothetical protein